MKYEESMLSGYLDGELNAEEMLVVERHLQRHPQDRDTLRALASLRQSLATLPAEAFSVDPVVGVRSRIAAEGPSSDAAPGAPDPLPSERSSTSWRLWIPLALAASLLAVATLAFTGRRWRATTLVATEVATDKQPARDGLSRSRDTRANRGLEREAPLDWVASEKAQSRHTLGDQLDPPSTNDWRFNKQVDPPRDRGAPASPAADSATESQSELFSREPGQPASVLPPPSPAPSKMSRGKLPPARVLEEERLAEQSAGAASNRLRRSGAGDADKPSTVVWYEIRHPEAPSEVSQTRLPYSQPTAEESIVFDVPAGQTELALHWIAERMNAPLADELQLPRARESQAEGSLELGDLPSGAVAIRVDAPPSELAGLVQSLRQLLSRKDAGDVATAGWGAEFDNLSNDAVARADNGGRASRSVRETLGSAAAPSGGPPSGGPPSSGIHAGAAAAEAVRQGSIWIIFRPQPNSPQPNSPQP